MNSRRTEEFCTASYTSKNCTDITTSRQRLVFEKAMTGSHYRSKFYSAKQPKKRLYRLQKKKTIILNQNVKKTIKSIEASQNQHETIQLVHLSRGNMGHREFVWVGIDLLVLCCRRAIIVVIINASTFPDNQPTLKFCT